MISLTSNCNSNYNDLLASSIKASHDPNKCLTGFIITSRPCVDLDTNRQTVVIMDYHCSPNGYQNALASALKTAKKMNAF